MLVSEILFFFLDLFYDCYWGLTFAVNILHIVGATDFIPIPICSIPPLLLAEVISAFVRPLFATFVNGLNYYGAALKFCKGETLQL